MYLSACDILPVHHFGGKYSLNTLYIYHHMSVKHYSFGIQRNFLNVVPKVDCWMGKGVDQRIFGPIATPLPGQNPTK